MGRTRKAAAAAVRRRRRRRRRGRSHRAEGGGGKMPKSTASLVGSKKQHNRGNEEVEATQLRNNSPLLASGSLSRVRLVCPTFGDGIRRRVCVSSASSCSARLNLLGSSFQYRARKERRDKDRERERKVAVGLPPSGSVAAAALITRGQWPYRPAATRAMKYYQE